MARGSYVLAAFAAGLLGLAMLFYGSPTGLPVALGDEAYRMVELPVTAVAHPNPRLEDAVLAWLNRARRDQYLPPLRADSMIQTVARSYGMEMFAHGYLSHVSRDGRTLQARLAAGGLQPSLVGENLAYAGTVRDAERALWQSEAHRKNILYPAYRVVGVAVLDGGHEGIVVVQDFSDDSAAHDNLTPAKVRVVTWPVLDASIVSLTDR
jgi:hypothetical protein